MGAPTVAAPNIGAPSGATIGPLGVASVATPVMPPAGAAIAAAAAMVPLVAGTPAIPGTVRSEAKGIPVAEGCNGVRLNGAGLSSSSRATAGAATQSAAASQNILK